MNKPGSDPDNLKVFDAIFTAKSVTKPPCLEALRKIWSSIPPVYSKMEKVSYCLLCSVRGVAGSVLTHAPRLTCSVEQQMIPSFIGCLAREGYERVQTIKIGSSIEQDGADLRAVHPEKGFAELCINAKTLTVSINGTMVRFSQITFPPCPTCLLTPCTRHTCHCRSAELHSVGSGRLLSPPLPLSRSAPPSTVQVRLYRQL